MAGSVTDGKAVNFPDKESHRVFRIDGCFEGRRYFILTVCVFVCVFDCVLFLVFLVIVYEEVL